MFDFPSENLRGNCGWSQICFQVAIGISGSIPECRPGAPGPGRDSDVTARGTDVVLANVWSLPILPFRLSGAMKLFWYDFEGRKFPSNIRVAYVLIISHQFPSLT